MHHTIFISGGATGIGAATAERFLAAGWNVGVMDFQPLPADHACAGRDGFLYTQGDVRSRSDIAAAVAATVEKFGPLGSVFANAGIHRKNTLLDISDEELKLIIDTNIYGTVNVLREAVPRIIEGGGGSVVINASDQFFVGKQASFAYGLTKGALGQITRSLAIDLGPQGVRVNAICPGTVRTPLVDKIFERLSEKNGKPVEEYWAEENALYARGRVGEPAEVAEMVYFLASESASFCTGGHYLIDGGLVCQ